MKLELQFKMLVSVYGFRKSHSMFPFSRKLCQCSVNIISVINQKITNPCLMKHALYSTMTNSCFLGYLVSRLSLSLCSPVVSFLDLSLLLSASAPVLLRSEMVTLYLKPFPKDFKWLLPRLQSRCRIKLSVRKEE